MNGPVIQFIQPGFLLLAPALLALLWLIRHHLQHYSPWHALLPAAFQASLLTRPRPAVLPWLLAATGVCLLALILARPVLPTTTGQQSVPPALVIVMQLTPDTLARDLPPSRLQQMQNKARQLLELQQPGAAAMVVYAGSAHILSPLSTDLATGNNLLDALHPTIMPLAGRNAADAIELALQQLQDSPGQIVLITQGLGHAEQRSIRQAMRKSGSTLHILGRATVKGAPVPHATTGLYPADGSLSRLEQEGLQRFARKQGFSYSPLEPGLHDLLITGLIRQQHDRVQLSQPLQRLEVGHWLLLPLLLTLAPLARKGWLFGLVLTCHLLLAPTEALYAEPLHPELRRIQQDPEQALQTLTDPLWRAIAAYHAEQYELALELFSGLDGITALYNRGNTLMQLGRYSEAEYIYQQVLKQNPMLQPALDNLRLARALMQQPTDGHNTTTTTAGQPDSSDDSDTPAQKTLHPAPAHPIGHSVQTSLDAWLQQIPDAPGQMLKHRFRHELKERQP